MTTERNETKTNDGPWLVVHAPPRGGFLIPPPPAAGFAPAPARSAADEAARMPASLGISQERLRRESAQALAVTRELARRQGVRA